MEFLKFLSSVSIPTMGPDGLKWHPRKDGVFDSRSYYSILSARPGGCFPWKSIWAAKAPPRVAFFVWTVAWGRILTCDNFMRNGYTMAGWCCMCCCDGETVDHLLLHCNFTHMLWSFIFKVFHIQWVLPQRVLDLLVGWRNWFGKHHSSIWNLVPLCLMWTIWRERNARVFDDQIRSPDLVLGTYVI